MHGLITSILGHKGCYEPKIHVIKYENLLNNPFNEIKILYKNLGLK